MTVQEYSQTGNASDWILPKDGGPRLLFGVALTQNDTKFQPDTSSVWIEFFAKVNKTHSFNLGAYDCHDFSDFIYTKFHIESKEIPTGAFCPNLTLLEHYGYLAGNAIHPEQQLEFTLYKCKSGDHCKPDAQIQEIFQTLRVDRFQSIQVLPAISSDKPSLLQGYIYKTNIGIYQSSTQVITIAFNYYKASSATDTLGLKRPTRLQFFAWAYNDFNWSPLDD